jgi:hypothetical protein
MKAILLVLTLFAQVQPGPAAGTSPWESAIVAAAQTIPELADTKSLLRLRTEQLREQYTKSDNPVERQAAADNAALYIAQQALERLQKENATQREIELAMSLDLVKRQFPDSLDATSDHNHFASLVLKEWEAQDHENLYRSNGPLLLHTEAARRLTEWQKQAAEKMQAAIAKYPTLADPKSPLSDMVNTLYAQWQKNNHSNLQSPDVVLLLCAEAQQVIDSNQERRQRALAAQAAAEQEVAEIMARNELARQQALAQRRPLQGMEGYTPQTRYTTGGQEIEPQRATNGKAWIHSSGYQPPATSARRSSTISVIETAPGHWMTSAGQQIIQTADGHWQTSDGTQIVRTADGHWQMHSDSGSTQVIRTASDHFLLVPGR